MALHFSANQYEKEFHPKRLQNWEVPKTYRERPQSLDGFTQIIASDRGHLLRGVPKSYESPWGKFVGTWDMPRKIPGNNVLNPTARSSYAIEELARLKLEGDEKLRGKSMVIRSYRSAPGSRQSLDFAMAGNEEKGTQTTRDKGIQAELSVRSGAKGVTPHSAGNHRGAVNVSSPVRTPPGSALSQQRSRPVSQMSGCASLKGNIRSPIPQTMTPVSQANAPVLTPECQ